MKRGQKVLYREQYCCMLDMYHREGIMGDYDEFDDVEDLIRFIDTGKR